MNNVIASNLQGNAEKAIDEKIIAEGVSGIDLEHLQDMIKKMKSGEFFEALTTEFSGKVREIALELVEFRKDIQKRLEPEIVEMAAKEIPEAS